MIKKLIKDIVFKIRIWYPPDWFVNPFFSPSLYTEYHWRNVPKVFMKAFNETQMRLTMRAPDRRGRSDSDEGSESGGG